MHTPPEPKLVFIDRDSEEPLSPDRALLVHADCLKEMNKVPIPAKPAPTPVSGGANSSEGGFWPDLYAAHEELAGITRDKNGTKLFSKL